MGRVCIVKSDSLRFFVFGNVKIQRVDYGEKMYLGATT